MKRNHLRDTVLPAAASVLLLLAASCGGSKGNSSMPPSSALAVYEVDEAATLRLRDALKSDPELSNNKSMEWNEYGGEVMCVTNIPDTAMVTETLASVDTIIGSDVILKWMTPINGDNIASLYALKAPGGEPALGGPIVIDARIERRKERVWDTYYISVVLTDEGAVKLAELSKQNIGKNVAMTVNGRLISVPTLMTEISSGRIEFGPFDGEGWEHVLEPLVNDIKSID